MSEILDNLRYSEEHEWAQQGEGRIVRIGITDHAQHLLGDIVFIEFPEIGTAVTAGESVGSIESVKTVSELYSPVSGTVTRVNEALEDSPELLNEQPYGDGWIYEVEVDGDYAEATAGLLAAAAYRELVGD
ncbi:glycine cleavage system protein GcvH [Paenibacillus sp. HN-1]|uniref:glycine cleavage system protein GcvH n=1 Tax=Paenibacillus TaxID=44249 RepID=UPI001CA7B76A|nr:MULTISPECIES: glycine cleavage system protein GcvH [Paenibacillus]MBY9077540.1 glycine cleavage system protein GcvH [Paenibacillus sp. CGMCC 1.18879]MBY9087811.1 glycine cleavage system protein GcvH [Paenibacillus sinensis]